MPTEQHVVVVGAGAAGHTAALTLRQEGYTGRLSVVHGEAHPPYNRTLVNKGALPGVLTPEQIALPPLDSLDVQVRPAIATEYDADAAELVLTGGERLRCTAVIAATGSTPRSNGLGGGLVRDRSERLLHLHTIQDAVRMRGLLGVDPGQASVILLGAGFIGGETASYLAEAGVDVHLVSRPALPLAPVLGKEIARRVAALHRDHVKSHFARTVVDVRAGTDSVAVTLDDGTQLETDFAVVAHGTVPAAAWLNGEMSGIRVDDRLRSQDIRGIYAAGSVALHTAANGDRYRIDHWDAAAAQGAHAARTLCHDLFGAHDPGSYLPATGFTLSLYRQPLAAFGVPLRGAEEQRQPTSSPTGVLTTFRAPGSRALTAVAAMGAGRELMAWRDRLQRP
jgi:3-phenylpropionate/trans-cinnamate dioxygenase ferredoxin reductase subunit